jgi:diguanylate cyclase (GGDEF)-like protein
MSSELLAAMAESTAKALEAEDLLAALRMITGDIAECIKADAAAILASQDDPPALVITTRRELGWSFIEGLAEKSLAAYSGASSEDLRQKAAVVIHGAPATDDSPDVVNDFISMPLIVNKRLLGLLAVGSAGRMEQEANEQVETAALIAGLLLQSFRRILESSSLDPLTGLFNRKRIQEELEYSATSTARFGHPVSIVVIDIDNLKTINEIFDHLTGDQVLREFAMLLRDVSRTSDVAGRIGGDEFVIVMPHTAAQEASQLANHIRSEVNAHQFCDGELKAGIHISIGVADSGGEALAAHELIGRADKALYEAKKGGGNRVAIA